MNYDPAKHHRRSIRLKGFDYCREGWYFITINAHNKQHLFGEVIEGKVVLSDGGLVVQKCWNEILNHFPFVMLDEFVVMPDHFHGIFFLRDQEKPRPEQKKKKGTGGKKKDVSGKKVCAKNLRPCNSL